MSVVNELFSVRDFLRYATSQFNASLLCYGHGTESAWDEAAALILHTLHLPHDIHPHILDARLTLKEREQVLSLIDRRVKERIPVPYLTHEAWFAGFSFYVDERVLIPRSPLAELIENRCQPWIDPEICENILDVCTGSGCIAIATAKYFPDTQIDALDISKDALEVAKLNILRHDVANQVHLYHSNLFESLPLKSYDLILANPPYVDALDMSRLPPEYRHEPELGLAAGEDGLNFVTDILQHATKYLSANGVLIVEVGNSEETLAEKYPEIPFTWLEFQRGGGGVFMLNKKALEDAQPDNRP